MQIQMFRQHYRALLKQLKVFGIEETNQRTGSVIRALQGGYSFKISLTDGMLPVASNRRYFPFVAAAETAWQLMGTKDASFIMQHAPKLWSKFLNEEGQVETAYGHRWRRHFKRDQLAQGVNALRDDPSNRQVYVSAWDPAKDGLGGEQPPNIPCPVGFSLNCCGGKVHMSVFIRSSDVFVGLPYDVMCYSLTLAAVAQSLGMKPGTICFTLGHAHVYQAHFEMMEKSVSHYDHAFEPSMADYRIPLPELSVGEILEYPNDYVDYVKNATRRAGVHPWDPKPEVIL